MPELVLNVVASTQRIEVTPTNETISVVNAGPQGAQGPIGTTGSGGGVPAGGTAGQVLTKVSSTNYDTTFAAIPAPTSIANTQLANMPSTTFKGNATGAPATPQDLTSAQMHTLLNLSTPWIAVTGLYTAPWTDYAAPYGPAKYRKLYNDIVELRGLVQGSSPTGVILTLPVGYRPQYEPIITVACYFGNAEIRVNTSGQVSVAASWGTSVNPALWTSLTGVRFSTLA